MTSRELIAILFDAHRDQVMVNLDSLFDAQELVEFFSDPKDLTLFAAWWAEHFDPESDMLTAYADWRQLPKPTTRKSTITPAPKPAPTTGGTSSAMRAFLQGTRKPPE